MKNKFKVEEDHIVIFIPRKGVIYECKIDLECLELVQGFKSTWHLNVNRTGRTDGVRTKTQNNHKRIQTWIHRLIMDCPHDKIIDHRDGDVLNNRKSNLRIVDVKINASNSKILKNNQSGYRNIYIEKDKFAVRIDNKRFGRYSTLEEAIDVAKEKRKLVFPTCERE